MNDSPMDADGSRAPLDELIPAEYEELRLIARRQLAMRDGEGTLSPTGLVHEAYLRLARGSHASGKSRPQSRL